MANLGRDGRYPSFAVGEEEDGRRAQEMTQKQPSSEAISRGCSSHSSHFCFGGVRSRVDGALTPGRTGVSTPGGRTGISMELVRQEEYARKNWRSLAGGRSLVDGPRPRSWVAGAIVGFHGLRSCVEYVG